MEQKSLLKIVEELIDTLHDQTKELEQLVERIEQVTPRLEYANQFSVVASQLAALHRQTLQLVEREGDQE